MLNFLFLSYDLNFSLDGVFSCIFRKLFQHVMLTFVGLSWAK